MENNKTTLRVSFAAIDPYIETYIVSPTEKSQNGRGWVEWGERNGYADYLLELSKQAPTLRAVINGTVDFIVGDDITIAQLPDTSYIPGVMNTRGDTIISQVESIARDLETYGGFALQIIRNGLGKIVEVYYCDIHFLRSNKDNTVFYYSENWNAGKRKIVEYPAFIHISPEKWATLSDEEKERNYNSILYVKREHTQTYPLPVYCAAVKECEIERCIADYHLNAINNGFTSSLIVNFNNGVPTDEVREEIEKNFNEKFSGHQNAGRIMFSWNDNKDAATTITEPKVEDFGDRYKALSSHVRQQIFTAFRANPNLFGIPTESLGFSQEEYESAFKLYNRTAIRPAQRLIIETYEKIYGQPGVMTIIPFSLQSETEKTVQ